MAGAGTLIAALGSVLALAKKRGEEAKSPSAPRAWRSPGEPRGHGPRPGTELTAAVSCLVLRRSLPAWVSGPVPGWDSLEGTRGSGKPPAPGRPTPRGWEPPESGRRVLQAALGTRVPCTRTTPRSDSDPTPAGTITLAPTSSRPQPVSGYPASAWEGGCGGHTRAPAPRPAQAQSRGSAGSRTCPRRGSPTCDHPLQRRPCTRRLCSSRRFPGLQAWHPVASSAPRTCAGGLASRSREEAEALEKELLEDYRFGQQQLIEIWGHACALAVTKAFPLAALPRKQPTVLVVCGPEKNGAIGLVCARHLRVFEYEPTIFYPKRSPTPVYQDFTTQCQKMDIPFLSYLPTEVQLINDAYNVVIDAILGVDAEPGEMKEPYTGILATLKQIRIPIVSLDVPSGWDAESGSSEGISPDVLVSLAAPKLCAARFLGRHHFVAGRFLPYDVQKKFELNLPEYPGTECVVSL
ncbi:yjeF N-terminal domain-containing protein 3 [Alligator sinensis]|uniref:ApoA-I-binding protein 2 n=1 Tax=Alligator sinensis TaxID=38654 RepID=A0A3Q0FXP5_ALLSI|nr:yjeF N-terminal domain-containing protein 3 [Alligator sinensis]